MQGPRCSLRSGNMYSDASPDYVKMTALNIPAAIGVSGSLNLALSSGLLVPACCSCRVSCCICSDVFQQQLVAVFVSAHPSCYVPRQESCSSPGHAWLSSSLLVPLSDAAAQALVHVPVQVLLALYLIDDFTGFQVTNLLELPEPYGIAFTWGIVLPTVFVFVASITNFIFQDNLILRVRGSCSVAICCKDWGRAAVPLSCRPDICWTCRSCGLGFSAATGSNLQRCDVRQHAVCIACMQLAGLLSLLMSAANCRDNARTATQQPRPTLATF